MEFEKCAIMSGFCRSSHQRCTDNRFSRYIGHRYGIFHQYRYRQKTIGGLILLPMFIQQQIVCRINRYIGFYIIHVVVQWQWLTVHCTASATLQEAIQIRPILVFVAGKFILISLKQGSYIQYFCKNSQETYCNSLHTSL